ncbi:MAG: ABC transporter ATP-binding protein [Chloroflexi bacterium]|nr:ABC transporter ATP-binding protein [Chloroflexota bacterium]
MNTLLDIKNLKVEFHSEKGIVEAVSNISYTLEKGKTLVVVGESGCGKSVHALSIMGLIPSPPGLVAGGEILFDGDDLLKLSKKEMQKVRGNQIAMVFQNPMVSLNPVFTVGAQIVEAIQTHQNMSDEDARERAVKLLDMVGIPSAEQRLDDFPHQFSGGMRQRAVIAMALSCDPELLIADEPTTALDVTIQAQIIELVKSLQEELGMAVLWITHDLGVAAGMADQINVMYAGHIVERSSAEEIFENPQHPYTQGLLASLPKMGADEHSRLTSIPGLPPNLLSLPAGCPFAPRCPYAVEKCVQENPPLNDIGGEHLVSCWRVDEALAESSLETEDARETAAKPKSTSDAPLLQVQGLKKYFPIKRGGLFRKHVGDIKAVDDLSFEIQRGETLGLVGESGSGKTTVGRTLLRLYDATAGEVSFEGRDVNALSASEMREMRQRMQLIFQDPYSSLNPRMKVGAIVGEPLLVHTKMSRAERAERVSELLSLVGLDPKMSDRFPHEFSGGQRQRIVIARALSLNPDFLVCDEPIASLDVSIQAQVVNLMEDLQEKLGLAYLFIAHDLSMVRHISNRIAVMYLGRIVELAERDELFEEPLHPYTQALISAVPVADPEMEKSRQRIFLEGDLPSPANPPKGCNFNTRCPQVKDICFESEPVYGEAKSGHFVACHLVEV